MNNFAMWTIIFGAMLLFIPQLADPYMTPRFMLPALGALPLLLNKSARQSVMEVPALIALALASLCTLFAADGWYGLMGAYLFPADSLCAFVVYIGVLIAAARSGWTVEEVARAIAQASVPVSLYAIFQKFSADPLLHGTIEIVGFRVVSTQGGPLFLAAVLTIASLSGIYLWQRGEKIGWQALGLALIAMYFTKTRGAILATAAGSALLLPWNRIWPVLVLALIGMAPRLISMQSDLGRLEIWKISWRMFLDNPWLGYGPGNFQIGFRRYQDLNFVSVMQNANAIQAHAHNDILHALATMGIAGLFAYAIVLASAVYIARQHFERRFLYAILVAYLVLSSFNPVTSSAIILIALFIGVASVRMDMPNRRIVPALACVAVACFFGRLCWAGWHFAQGAYAKNTSDAYKTAVEFNRAAQLNPWEIIFTCRQIDALIGMMGVAAPGNEQIMMNAAIAITDRALRWHPLDSYAHEIRGKVEVVAAMRGVGNYQKGVAYFNRAQELAPTFEPLMWRRHAMHKALGEKQAFDKVNSEIQKLRDAARGKI